MNKESLTFASYNTKGADNPAGILAGVRGVMPDILAVQEAGIYPRWVINRLSEELGLPYFTVSLRSWDAKKYGLGVATASRYEFVGEPISLEGFRNAALLTVVNTPGIGEIAVVNTHLIPFSEEQRLKELDIVLNELQKTGTDKHIITGDLNSLTDEYDHNDLKQQFNRSQREKFMNAGEIQHDVVKRLCEAGYLDIAVENNDRSTTVPTPANVDAAHGFPLRLDYMFVSEALARHIYGYEVARNEYTDQASDHYPVVGIFTP